jgi:hypothetical protein
MIKQLQEPTTQSPPRFLAARENPLCMDIVTRIKYRFASGDWPSHLDRLGNLNYRAAIVGPQGSGKTTLLYELYDRLCELGLACDHIFLPDDRHARTGLLNRALEKGVTDSVLLVDGMERLSLRQRWNLLRATRRGPGLVVNLHHECRFPEKIPIWIRTRTSPELIADLIRDLDLDVPEIQSAGAAALEKSNGNIRDALRELYDQFASGQFNKILSR